MTLDFQIHPLRDFPQFADACAAWAYGEWTSQSQLRRLQDVLDDYQRRVTSDKLPRTWVAISNQKPIGMVTFKTSGEHPDMSDERPWLSSLVVHPHYRGRGVAAQLIAWCQREAKETYQFDVLYLYTASEAFYHPRGWQRIGTVRDPSGMHPEGCALMKKDLK